ncbi:hypothetical protein [Companilactobacillus mishanensis]|nr:hypothetical protein [Companilactobacillus mishanensis]
MTDKNTNDLDLAIEDIKNGNISKLYDNHQELIKDLTDGRDTI